MTGQQGLRRFEEKLVAVKTFASMEDAWSQYRASLLPEDLTVQQEALIHQGFEAGYPVAMALVSKTLAGVQTTVIQEERA